ncbi:hypothetical protein [Tamaricihabitans halophyticus]|uniref:hypothetical protein n=1 Tax=Tamaricihabitans halophyticus TaxID=1262583 RepID=UPI00104F1F53|nr:hypothetical protein [Tamaricihabitans halophyticus]
MPRRNRPNRSRSAGTPARPTAATGLQRTESGPDGDWVVRHIPGERTTKHYRCPGCDHEIRPGTPHLVAWSADQHGSVDDRRHWHSGCWQARARRGPTRRR